mgnify:FL=1
MSYAKATTVSRERTIGEFERTLARYGATAFAYGWQGNRALVEFIATKRRIRFTLAMPPREDFLYTPSRRYTRSEAEVDKLWEQSQRSRWRALLLVVKAKLEAVEAGIAEFEEEFLAYIVLPDGQTVGQFTLPQVELAYELNTMPPMLPTLGEGSA